MANKDKQSREIKKRKAIPDHYVQDVDYILREFIDKIRTARRANTSSVFKDADTRAKLIKLVIDAVEIHDSILADRQAINF